MCSYGYARVVAFASSVSSSTSGRSDCGMDVSLTCTVCIELPATTVMIYSYSSGLAPEIVDDRDLKEFQFVEQIVQRVEPRWLACC